MDEHDDDHDDDERGGPPAVSRLARSSERRYRTLSRPTRRFRDPDRPRLRRQLPLVELIARIIERHGLTDAVRQRCVCLWWPEIAGERIASKTFPVSFAAGVLHVSASNSSWVHELHFYKAELIEKINRWVDANRTWLGPPPLVLDMRFALAMQQRQPLVDQDHVRRLRLRHARRMRPRVEATPPIVSDADRAAIRAETAMIADAELRALIEDVRVKWNR